MRDERKIFIFKESGKKKVRIENSGYGLDMLTMRNGYQWTGFGVDDELLEMMRDSIDEYFAKTHNKAVELDGANRCACVQHEDGLIDRGGCPVHSKKSPRNFL